MLKLEDIKNNALIKGVHPNTPVQVIQVVWYGTEAIELTYRDGDGKLGNQILYRSDEERLELVDSGKTWSFNGDGSLFRLVSEAQRIHLAHLFDPLLAIHTSIVEPLPHQITAVYGSMLPRQPLRFLLADDPGAGKTIMAGLLIKELIVRGDVQRCLVVCPGNLVEQWQDELFQRFHLPFEILTKDKTESSKTGNWFLENDLVIARLDMLSRNPTFIEQLKAPECRWDLVICDEAHKMSATFFGSEVKYTKRYQLGKTLSQTTRHFLLMTATPHNGKETDFQLFMALLDPDRFEGKPHGEVQKVEISDIMRRMIKEELYTFEGKPLFPERFAYTIPYSLSLAESSLYETVTHYVREEFNRAEKLINDQRRRTVSFALMVLQRRLASSPEAIYQSLKNRRERLQQKLEELQKSQIQKVQELLKTDFVLDDELLNDIDDIPDAEIETLETEVLDEATAARTIEELQNEIATLQHLEKLASTIRHSGEDTKWRELAKLIQELYAPVKQHQYKDNKLVIFTEHRDTLRYLYKRIITMLGRTEAVVTIHGSMGREDRMRTQETFKYNPEVLVLIATDAAGEGINLQRAHLMVNYDLPWNPNRIEQRFGRIHRIGQTEVCYLWNLVAVDTREGDVYRILLDKLNEARNALGGQVFNVLGKLEFEGKSLRELLIEAIRYGSKPEVKEKLNKIVEHAFDKQKIQNLINDFALVHDVMDLNKIMEIRAEMERAEARRLQPHYIESFFKEAFKLLNGSLHKREPGRYEITHVPPILRQKQTQRWARSPILERYERVTFLKEQILLQGKPMAAFVCPGMPLLDSLIEVTLDKYGSILQEGTILVDENDTSLKSRIFFYMIHELKDACSIQEGNPHIISKRVLYIEVNEKHEFKHIHYAPYLDYRPLRPDEPSPNQILQHSECSWIKGELLDQVKLYGVTKVAPEHLTEVRTQKIEYIEKTRAAVKVRLLREIHFWDQRAEELKIDEKQGKVNAKLNWQEARKRADALQERLENRLYELDLESQISSLPPLIQGSFIVVPIGLIHAIQGRADAVPTYAEETQESAARARAIVMEVERRLGYEPVDVELQKLGYDIESRDPTTGKLRFIEVKGRVSGANTITVTRNEVLYSLNKPDQYILAIVEFFTDGSHKVHYVRRPFTTEPDFAVVSQNYNLSSLLAKAEEPR